MRPGFHRLFACACLALSMSLVGSYVALSKPLVAAVPVFLLAWLRFAIGGAAMLPWLRKLPEEPPMAPRTKKLLFLEAFLGNFLFSICMLYGVSMTTAVSAGVIMGSLPAAVAVMSWTFLGERIGARTWGAVGCAALGIGLLGLGKAAGGGSGLAMGGSGWLGDLLVFGAVLCEAAYAVIGKTLTGTLTPKRITSLVNLWGLGLMTPLGIYVAVGFDFATLEPRLWLLLIFYSLAASVWAVWLWMTGLQQISAAQSGVFTVLLPVCAALVGVFGLGEEFGSIQRLAFGLAVVSVLLATVPVRGRDRVAPDAR